ncbi:hypothetical protein AMTRI_Chr02g215720 [Amborella trichopoda]
MAVRSCDLRMDDNDSLSYEEVLLMDGKPPDPKTNVLASSSLGSNGGGHGYGYQVVYDGNKGNQALRGSADSCGHGSRCANLSGVFFPTGGLGLKDGSVKMVPVGGLGVPCEAGGEYGDGYQVAHDGNKGNQAMDGGHGVVGMVDYISSKDTAAATSSKLLASLIEGYLARYMMLDGSSNSSTSGAKGAHESNLGWELGDHDEGVLARIFRWVIKISVYWLIRIFLWVSAFYS